jgi:hypothetical protein
MKLPLVILIAIVVSILGFLVVYSLQHDMPAASTTQGHGAAGGYGSAPSAGGYGSGSAPASGGYGTPPATGGYGTPPAAGGYGTPPAAGGYGK